MATPAWIEELNAALRARDVTVRPERAEAQNRAPKWVPKRAQNGVVQKWPPRGVVVILALGPILDPFGHPF